MHDTNGCNKVGESIKKYRFNGDNWDQVGIGVADCEFRLRQIRV